MNIVSKFIVHNQSKICYSKCDYDQKLHIANQILNMQPPKTRCFFPIPTVNEHSHTFNVHNANNENLNYDAKPFSSHKFMTRDIIFSSKSNCSAIILCAVEREFKI